MMKLFDSHAHYFDARFFSDECPVGGDELLSRLFSEGEVEYILNVGTDVPTSLAAVAQATRYAGMYAAAGVHPSDAMRYADMDGELAKLETILRAKDNKVVALGEIGLDYHYPETDKKGRQIGFLHSWSWPENLTSLSSSTIERRMAIVLTPFALQRACAAFSIVIAEARKWPKTSSEEVFTFPFPAP